MHKKMIITALLAVAAGLSAGQWQYKNSAGKMKLPVLKKMYDTLRSSKTPEDREKNLCVWDEVLRTRGCANDPALAAFYNWCTSRAIDEIKAYNGKNPRLWKFYSSGVIIKANGIVRAFDLNCGCELEVARTRFRFTQENVRKLAALIDEYYTPRMRMWIISVSSWSMNW